MTGNKILELAEQVLDFEESPEGVCASTPELMSAVKDRLLWCEGAAAIAEDLFPSRPIHAAHALASHDPPRLPSIPGYEVTGLLGRGGAGIVYSARHLKLNRVVALKMMLAGEFATDVELQRFMREARADAVIKHPNVVDIYDIDESDGRPYFTWNSLKGEVWPTVSAVRRFPNAMLQIGNGLLEVPVQGADRTL